MSQENLKNAQVYVGTYRKYNNGDLTGKWVAMSDFDSLEAFVKYAKNLHKDEPDPELMYSDYSDGAGLISERAVNPIIFDLIAEMSDMSEQDQVALTCFIGDKYQDEDDADELIERFRDAYEGDFSREIDFTYYIVEECGYLDGVSENITRYFDYKAFSRDLFLTDYDLIDGHVFRQWT